MVLTRDEYIKMEIDFSNQYHDEITALLKEKKQQHLKKELEHVNLQEFFKKYAGSALFIFVIALFAFIKEILSFEILFVCTFLLFIIYVYIYDEWKRDMKRMAIRSFYREAQLLVADFVYKKMLIEIPDTRIGFDFETKVQFYSIAIHDIPLRFYINVDEL